ncbi:MAG: FG-GAP-like repeat-containing protein [Acidobacteriota bacterium]
MRFSFLVCIVGSLNLAVAQSCPPVNFVQGSIIPVFGSGEASDLQRQSDGSFTRNLFSWNRTGGTSLGLGTKIQTSAKYDQTFGNCAGTNRTFKLPAAWQAVADQLGTSSRNPVAGNLLGDGTVVGIGSYTSNGNKAYVVISNADGTVRSTSSLNVSTNAVGYLIADFNGDNKKDLAVAKFGDGGSDKGGIGIFLGNGDGTFRTPVTYPAGQGAEGATAFDFNGDGKLDLAVANYSSNDVGILLGNGDGTFRAPVSYPMGASGFAAAVGDFNGDGKPDLVASSVDSNTLAGTGRVVLLQGNGDGTFQASRTLISNIAPRGLATGDFNKDAKLDLVITDSLNRTTILMLGNGTGTFTVTNVYQSTFGSPFAVDLDGDNNLDVVVAAGHPDALTANAGIKSADAEEDISVLFGKGDGTLLGAPVFKAGQLPSGIAAGDFNGDGRVDLAITSSGSKDITILTGIGAGQFQVGSPVAITGATPTSLVAAKLDGDNNFDLAVTDGPGNKVFVLISRGDGTFVPGVGYTVGGNPVSVAAGDLNGDGKSDLVVASSGNPAGINVLLNNGTGGFQPSQSIITGVTPTSVAIADVNKDGKSDIVGANPATGVLVLLGSGSGTFQPAVTYAADFPVFVATGDMNGDGSVDIVVAGPAGLDVPFTGVLLNNGNGTFGAIDRGYISFRPSALVVADLNGDGKLDVAVAECCGEANVAFLLNSGTGSVVNETYIRGGNSHVALVAADLNGDQRADLVVGDGTTTSGFVTILLNTAVTSSSNPITTINAASLLAGSLAPDSFVTAKGSGLASGSAAAGLVASTIPYPPVLGGTTAKVKDSAGVERSAPLYYVSATQVNYVLPVGTGNGLATVTITAADGTVSSGQITVASVGPGLFMFGGTNIAAANVIRVRDGVTTGENVYAISGGNLVAAPIDLGPATDTVALVLYGTGIRGRTALDKVSLTIGGAGIPVAYAGAQSQYPALDQINIILARSLVGKGDVAIVVTVDGQTANVAHVSIK